MNNDPKQQGQYRPSRALNGKRYVYIWHGWADGEKTVPITMGYNSEPIQIMETLSKENPRYVERVRFYRFRVPEEFYDTWNDPGCLNNLIGNPNYQKMTDEYRMELLEIMSSSFDHELKNFKQQVFKGGVS